MAKYLQILLILVVFTAFSQNHPIDTLQMAQRIQYVSNPNPLDTLCIAEIQRAKKDIENGKIVFAQPFGFLFGSIRYEKELRQLCRQKGLQFEFDLIGCLVLEGQTQGCYADYMDKVIFYTYGIDFKAILHKQADSLFLFRTVSKNILVDYWICDERPRLPHEKNRTSDYLPSIVVDSLPILKKSGEFGGWPFIDLGFIVEKDSTLSGFLLNNFVAQLEENEKYKNELYSIAVSYMNTSYPIWVPGSIAGVPVRARNNVRLFFKKE
ncbi:MAG: hypothetical protein LAT76_10660 [Schleiferiaceae bacterium]|nr:hypothetical protein [Schleiferiaceae bacterium]